MADNKDEVVARTSLTSASLGAAMAISHVSMLFPSALQLNSSCNPIKPACLALNK